MNIQNDNCGREKHGKRQGKVQDAVCRKREVGGCQVPPDCSREGICHARIQCEHSNVGSGGYKAFTGRQFPIYYDPLPGWGCGSIGPGFQPPFGLDGGHAARPGGGDGLTEDMVLNIPAGEYALDAGTA